MARLLPNGMFVGSMSNVSAYKRHDSDKIIIRTKGGANKRKIKTSPVFEEVRKNNMEFGGRASTTSRLLRVFDYLHPIADYNLAGPLISLLKPIQELDFENPKGRRSVLISRNPRLLEGFNINRKHPFEWMILNPLESSLSKETFSGQVELPALIPGVNFRLPDANYPVYRFTVVLAIIPDMFCGKHRYYPPSELEIRTIKHINSDWFSVPAGSAPQKLEVELPKKPALLETSAYSLMLAAGIGFGRFNATGGIDPVKYVGCGKVVKMK